MGLVTQKSDLGKFRHPFVTPPLEKRVTPKDTQIPSLRPITEQYLKKIPTLSSTSPVKEKQTLPIKNGNFRSVATTQHLPEVVSIKESKKEIPYKRLSASPLSIERESVQIRNNKKDIVYPTPEISSLYKISGRHTSGEDVVNNSEQDGRHTSGLVISNNSSLSGRHTNGSLLSQAPPIGDIVANLSSGMDRDGILPRYSDLLPLYGAHDITNVNYSTLDISLPITNYISTLPAFGIHGNPVNPISSNLDIDSIPAKYIDLVPPFGRFGNPISATMSRMDIDNIPLKYQNIVGNFGQYQPPIRPNMSVLDIDFDPQAGRQSVPSGRYNDIGSIQVRFPLAPISQVIRSFGTLAVNFFSDKDAKGFRVNQNLISSREKSQFVGITNNKYLYTGNMLEVLRNPTDGSDKATLSNQLGKGNSFFKSTGFNEAKKYADNPYDLALRYTERHSPSYLDQLYAKFDLQDSAYNPTYMLQPYVIRGLQNKDVRNPQRWGQIMDAGMIRGGASVMATRSAFDIVRIGKFLASPKGLLFILQQQGLQLTNPKVETAFNVPLRNTRLYNPATTLAQVAGVGLGTHLRRHGLQPVIEFGRYEDVIKVNNSRYINQNRLVKIGNQLLPKMGLGGLLKQIIGSAVTGNAIMEISGLAGPNSVYGAGVTMVNRYVNSFENTDGNSLHESFSRLHKIKSWNTLQYDQLNKNTKRIDSSLIGAVGGETEYHDFRKALSDPDFPHLPSREVTERFSYTRNNLANKFGFGDPGKPGLDRTDFRKNTAGDNSGDVINSSEPDEDPTLNGKIRDLIKFRFKDPDNDSALLVFRATITNFNDLYTATYNNIRYIGSPENMYFYTNHERRMTFTFTVTAFSRGELLPMWRRINRLATLTAPAFNSNKTMTGAKWTRLTIGDYLVDKPVLLNSVTITDANASWDIDLELENRQLPMHANITVDFTILNDTVPSYKDSVFIGSPTTNNNTVNKPVTNKTATGG